MNKNLIFTTHNKNKLIEAKEYFKELNITIIGLSEMNIYEIATENGKSIEENAIIKANFYSDILKKDVFSDDSGLEVEALNNEPGVNSANYAGGDANANNNIDLLLKNMENIKNRNAKFKTILALKYNNKIYLFEGSINGFITTERKGTSGFGYDPIFIPIGEKETFAQMGLSKKNLISHRSIAFEKMLSFIKKNIYN